MAGASEIRAGRAFVEIAAKDKGFAAGLDKAAKRLKAFGKTVTMIGGAVTAFAGAGFGVLGAALKSFAESGSSLNDMAARTGASVEALSALGYAAKQTGVEITDVEAGMRKAQKTISDAARGGDQAAKALAQLGLTAADLAGLSPDEQFERIMQALAGIPDPANRTAAAMAVLGKSGAKLIPLAADMEKLTAEAKALGLVMSTADAKAADDLGHAWDRLTATGGALKNTIGAALAPALMKLLELVQGVATSTVQWVNNNRRLVVSLAQGLAAVLALGVGLTVTGLAIKAVGMGLAVLMTPLGALAAGMLAGAAAAAALLHWAGMLPTIMETLGAAFNRAWGGIKDALMAGDLELAWKIVMQSLKVQAMKAVTGLVAIWQGFKAQTLIVFDTMFATIAAGFAGLKSLLATAILDASAYLKEALEASFGASGGKFAEKLLGFKIDKATIDGAKRILVEDALREVNKIQRDLAKSIAARGAAAAAAALGAGADLAAEEAELQDLLNQAKAANRAELPGLGRRLDPNRGGLQSMLPSGVSSGSFDPNAAGHLGRGNPILEKMTETLKSIDDTLDEQTTLMRDGGLKFA